MISFRYVSPLDLPRLDLDAALDGKASGVYVEPPGTERTFIRRRPLFHDDPDGAGLFADLPDVPVVYPPAFVASARDCSLVGYRTILTDDGRFFNDDDDTGKDLERYFSNLRQPIPFLNEGTGLRPLGETADFVLERAGRPQRHLDGSTLVLASHEPISYGSWLFRVLPKLAALKQRGIGKRKILVHAHAVLREYLSLCGVAAEHIIAQDVQDDNICRADTIYRMDHAIVPCQRNRHALLDHESCDFYDELRARCGVPQAGRRLYISRLGYARRGGANRVMSNESELVDRLVRLNFDIVEPETLSPRQQIETFSAAEMIVGPASSAMFNTVFCHPGTKLIDIESERHWAHAHLCLFSSLQLRFGIFEGKVDAGDPAPVHRRWSANVEALVDRIAAFAAA